MLTEMVRLSYQHRAFYCYVILSVWIFLLVAGMYKYMGVDESNLYQSKSISSDRPIIREFSRHFKPDIKTKKIFKLCNTPDDIIPGVEGKIDTNLTLEGVFIFIRHGDRGPLAHIRNISTINCAGDLNKNTKLNTIYENYKNFLNNATQYYRSIWTQFLGPFHGFPMLPSNKKYCKIGELTTLGIGQLLKIGLLLKNAYFNKLNFSNNTITTNDIIVYSTKYRRTVQSAIALLYTFLNDDDDDNNNNNNNNYYQNFAKLILKESSSYTFCNNECACPTADKYLKKFYKETGNRLKSHPAVGELIKQSSKIVFEMPDQIKTSHPYNLRDALLTYICHGASLPCINNNSKQCIKNEHISSLFAYTEWETRLNIKSINYKKYGLLRAYGMLKNIVNHMVQMISESKPKIVLFSGHDKTLEYLSIALGILSENTIIPNFATRFIIEICRTNNNINNNNNNNPNDYYFRIIVNGKDVTQKISYCKFTNYYSASYIDKNNDGDYYRKEYKLCSIESIIRQIHDDYFSPFNSTNFKDACTN